MVVFGPKMLYLGKIFVLVQKYLYSGKMLVFGQKCLYSGKSGCIRARWSNSENVDVFWQNGSILVKIGCIR